MASSLPNYVTNTSSLCIGSSWRTCRRHRRVGCQSIDNEVRDGRIVRRLSTTIEARRCSRSEVLFGFWVRRQHCSMVFRDIVCSCRCSAHIVSDTRSFPLGFGNEQRWVGLTRLLDSLPQTCSRLFWMEVFGRTIGPARFIAIALLAYFPVKWTRQE